MIIINMKYTVRYILVTLSLIFAGIDAASSQTRDLDYYIHFAMENSPLLKENDNQLLINQLDSLILKANYKPQISAGSTAIYPPIIKGYGYDEAITNGGEYNALLSFNQTILFKKHLQAQLNSYNLETQSIRNTQKIAEQDIKLAITAQYIAAYSNWQDILFNGEILELLKQEELALKQLTERSVYKQTDYLNFSVNLQQQQLSVGQLRKEYMDNIAILNYMCGIIDTAGVQLRPPDILLKLPPMYEATLQFDKFRIDSLKLKNSDALIDYSYQPKLSIFADAGFNSSFSFEPYKNFGASVGLSLSMPVYDGNQRKKQHDKIRISELIRRDYQDFSRRQYNQQLLQLYQQLTQTDNLISQAQSVVKYSEALMEAYRKQIQTGDTSITDYILAINNYLNAKYAVTQNTTNKMQIINQINYWNDEK